MRGQALLILLAMVGIAMAAPQYRANLSVSNADAANNFSDYIIELNISSTHVRNGGNDITVVCGNETVAGVGVRRLNASLYAVRFPLRVPAGGTNTSCAAYYGDNSGLHNNTGRWLESRWNLYYNFTRMSNASLSGIAAGTANWSIQPSTALPGQKSLRSSSNVSLLIFNDVVIDPENMVEYYGYNSTPTLCGAFNRRKCLSVMFIEAPNTTNYYSSWHNGNWVAFPINSHISLFFNEGGGSFFVEVREGWQKYNLRGTFYEEGGGYSANVIYGQKSHINGTVIRSLAKGVAPFEFYFAGNSDIRAALTPFSGAEYHAVAFAHYSENVTSQAGTEEYIGAAPPEIGLSPVVTTMVITSVGIVIILGAITAIEAGSSAVLATGAGMLLLVLAAQIVSEIL